MLIGMGDYGVLWISRYEQERQGGASVLDALQTTSGSVGPGILTAATTTALSFYAAMLADFQAVAELGWIAGSGVLLCAFSCFTVMPAMQCLLEKSQRQSSRDKNDGRFALILRRSSSALRPTQTWLPGLAARPRWVLGVSA